MDGKAERGARQADGRAVHLLSALIHGTKFVVAQRDVAHKTNEIPEIKVLLGPLGLAGWAVTLDAMHCQKETARFLVEVKLAHDHRHGETDVFSYDDDEDDEEDDDLDDDE